MTKINNISILNCDSRSAIKTFEPTLQNNYKNDSVKRHYCKHDLPETSMIINACLHKSSKPSMKATIAKEKISNASELPKIHL